MKKLNSALMAWMSVVVLAVVFGSVSAADSQKAMIDPVQQIMESYFATGELLAEDSFKEIDKEVEKIISASEEILNTDEKNGAEKKNYLASVEAIHAAARDFDSQDLKSARESYKSLSQAVTNYVKAYGYTSSAYSFYCPMVDQTWFQSSEKIANPFYGSEMLRCGKLTGMVKQGEYIEKKSEDKKEKTKSLSTEHKSCCG
jgi:hypothetical protein